jgi:hypothetical protein
MNRSDIGDVPVEVGLSDDLQRGHTGRADKWIAAKGRAMAARRDLLGDVIADDRDADGQAVGEGLGQRHDIGHGAAVLPCPGSAGPEGGLDLVENQKSAGSIAETAQTHHVLRRCRAHAALPLDRLQNYCRGTV